MIYNKLVRDYIPDIIEENGNVCITSILDDKDYLEKLNEKLIEEVNEYIKDKNLEELADILEVIYACTIANGYTLEQLEQVRADKASRRGTFSKKVFLEFVYDKL